MADPERPLSLLDLLPRDVKVNFSTPETVEDARQRRHKDMVMFYVALGFVVVLALVLSWVTFVDSKATDQQRQWGWAGLMSIAAGFVGYLFGKGSRSL